jgi:hypothetical protein
MPRVIDAFSQFFDNDGDPLVDGWLQFLVSGTNNTDKDTFADVNETVANSNPVQLDASGRCPNVFGTGTYRVISFTNDPVSGTPDTQIQQFDPVEGVTSTTGFSTWDSETVYNIPDIVLDSSLDMYRSITNLNTGNDPSLSPENWEQIEFEQLYNENKTYSEFDRVIHSSGYPYISKVSSNVGNDPETSPTKWTMGWTFPEVTTFTVYGSGTYTKPTGLRALIVEVVGGGGGGGGVDGQAAAWGAGAGGGAGGYCKDYIDEADIGATETMTVGAGGTGGAAGPNNGAAGSTSSFGSHCQATGGSGGAGNIATATTFISVGSSGGVGSGGDINAKGGQGRGAIGIGFGTVYSGKGGMSFFGEGGSSVIGDSNGEDAVAGSYGAGGSGACADSIATNYSGGDGAAGVIVVTELF